MNLKDLAKQPQLIKVTIDDEEIVKEYGEPLDFYCYDRQPMDMFLKVAANDKSDFAELANLLKDMVLDENGEQVIKDGLVLPPKVMIPVFTKMVSVLGK